MTDDFGYTITPLPDDAVAINGHSGAQAIASRAGIVHTLDHDSRKPPVHCAACPRAVGRLPFPVGTARKTFGDS